MGVPITCDSMWGLKKVETLAGYQKYNNYVRPHEGKTPTEDYNALFPLTFLQ
jgi:hypothetical protein